VNNYLAAMERAEDLNDIRKSTISFASIKDIISGTLS
jgi:hypothetical protein